MTKTTTLALFAIVGALGACTDSTEAADAQAERAAEANNLAAPVELPPAEEARVTFRCQPGNTLQTVVFFAGNRQVGLLNEGGPALTMLKRTEEQGPYTMTPEVAASTLPAGGNDMAAANNTMAAGDDTAGTTLTGDRTNVIITESGQPTRRCSV